MSKIFLPHNAASNTFGRDEPVVLRRVSSGRFRRQEGFVVQAVATCVDLWVLVFALRGFWVSSFSGSESASATVGKAMAYVVALGE